MLPTVEPLQVVIMLTGLFPVAALPGIRLKATMDGAALTERVPVPTSGVTCLDVTFKACAMVAAGGVRRAKTTTAAIWSVGFKRVIPIF